MSGTQKAPSVLVVTSNGSPGSAVVPVLAALEAHGHKVRAIDVGRLGSPSDGTVGRVFKAITGEFAERRLSRELAANPPTVSLAFDPGSVAALASARDEALKPAPVVAVVPELSPGPAWGETDADRYCAIDDDAAVALADSGVAGERVLAVGPLCEVGFAAAARQKRDALRKKFKLPVKAPVVVVEVDGLGYDTTSQVVLQLSLLGDSRTVYLFAAGDDAEAATALRRQVPTLDLKAKLFGNTKDAPLYWRAADVAVAKPTPRAISRALVLNIKMVSFHPDDKRGEGLATALTDRGVGALATNPLLIASALEPLLSAGHKPSNRTGTDGAANVADIVAVIAREPKAVIDESVAQSADPFSGGGMSDEEAERMTSAAGELEDLGGGSLNSLFDDDDGAPERSRGSGTTSNRTRARPPRSRSAEDSLADLKRKTKKNVDDELARLKKKMKNKGRKK